MSQHQGLMLSSPPPFKKQRLSIWEDSGLGEEDDTSPMVCFLQHSPRLPAFVDLTLDSDCDDGEDIFQTSSPSVSYTTSSRRKVSDLFALLPTSVLAHSFSFLPVVDHFALLSTLSKKYRKFMTLRFAWFLPDLDVLELFDKVRLGSGGPTVPAQAMSILAGLGFQSIRTLGPIGLAGLANNRTRKLRCRSLELSSKAQMAPLGRMTALEELELLDCQGPTDYGIVSLASLPQLRKLTITEDYFCSLKMTKWTKKALSGLPIEHITLHVGALPVNGLGDVLPEKIPLRNLDLRVEKGFLAKTLNCLRLYPLETLSLYGFKGGSLSQLSGLALKKLEISSATITNADLATLASLPSLSSLSLDFCNLLTFNGLSSLSRFESLTDLSLAGTNLEYDEAKNRSPLAALKGFNRSPLAALKGFSLRRLSLRMCGGLNAQVLQALPQGMAALDELDLSMTKITDDCLAGLRGLPITKLHLSYCCLIRRKGLLHLAHLPNLRELNLTSTNVEDASLCALASCVGLQSLSLRFCKHVSGEGYVSGLSALASLPLTELDLFHTGVNDASLLCDVTLRALQRLPLKTLVLRVEPNGLFTQYVTERGVAALCAIMPQLQVKRSVPDPTANDGSNLLRRGTSGGLQWLEGPDGEGE
eukprot:g39370.t1